MQLFLVRKDQPAWRMEQPAHLPVDEFLWIDAVDGVNQHGRPVHLHPKTVWAFVCDHLQRALAAIAPIHPRRAIENLAFGTG
jgi:hypothetical protein